MSPKVMIVNYAELDGIWYNSSSKFEQQLKSSVSPMFFFQDI